MAPWIPILQNSQNCSHCISFRALVSQIFKKCLMLFFIPWMTRLTKCRQLLNLAVCCHQRGLGQEVFSIDMTNQFPCLKIKWGISEKNRSLSLISTCLMSVNVQSHTLSYFFSDHHFTCQKIRPGLISWCWFFVGGGFLMWNKKVFEELWESARVSVLSLFALLFLPPFKLSPSWGKYSIPACEAV